MDEAALGFEFKIGDFVIVKNTSGLRAALITSRIWEQCPGGVQRHYIGKTYGLCQPSKEHFERLRCSKRKFPKEADDPGMFNDIIEEIYPDYWQVHKEHCKFNEIELLQKINIEEVE